VDSGISHTNAGFAGFGGRALAELGAATATVETAGSGRFGLVAHVHAKAAAAIAAS
jgi:hypothetical protein